MPIESFLNNHEIEKKKYIKSEKYNGNIENIAYIKFLKYIKFYREKMSKRKSNKTTECMNIN